MGGVNLLFAGALNKGSVEPSVYIELIKQLKHRKLFRTKFFSSGNAVDDLKNKEDLNITHLNWIPHEQLRMELHNSDILLSIAQIEGKQISSKIFEYMSYGKPILHIYYSDEDINLKYLKKYPLSICIKADDISSEGIDDLEYKMIAMSRLRMSFDDVKKLFENMTPLDIAIVISGIAN